MAETAPSDRRRPVVIVTRSVEDNRSLTTRLVERGYDVVAVPLVEVVGPADGGHALAAAAERLRDFRWVVLTSANGVAALAAALDDRPWPTGPGTVVEVAAVGPTTAAAARAAGMPVALVPDEATAAGLVEAFPEAFPQAPSATGRTGSNRVLAPLAELASSTVEDGLADLGWTVERVEAYRTRAPWSEAAPARIPSVAGADVVTFFSPSAVDRWVERFGSAPPLAVCIGPATARRARELGLTGVVTADPHTETGVVDAVGAHASPRAVEPRR